MQGRVERLLVHPVVDVDPPPVKETGKKLNRIQALHMANEPDGKTKTAKPPKKRHVNGNSVQVRGTPEWGREGAG